MFSTKQIAAACHLSEAGIRQWLSRSPHFTVGTLRGQVRSYSPTEALTIAVAAEMLRHSLGRPHECLPAAKSLVASSCDSAWVHRPRGGVITTSATRPDATSIHIPVGSLRERLSGLKKGTSNG